MNSFALAAVIFGVVVVGAIVLVFRLVGMSVGARGTSDRRPHSSGDEADVFSGVLAADSTIDHRGHDHHHGAHNHDSAGHSAHVGHDAGGHAGFDAGHSGFDGGHGGFDGGSH